MSTRSSIKFMNSTGQSLTAVVEPWATEFDLPHGTECEVFSIGGTEPHRIDIELISPRLIFYVETAGATYEYWQDGVHLD